MGQENERAERAARGQITSPSEAMDELLGIPSAVAEPPVSVDAGDGDDDGDCALSDDGDLGLEVFLWSLKDPFFLFSDADSIAMGGGASFALYIEKDLLHGMSEPCPTFDSPVLSSLGNFIISDFEMWAFDD